MSDDADKKLLSGIRTRFELNISGTLSRYCTHTALLNVNDSRKEPLVLRNAFFLGI